MNLIKKDRFFQILREIGVRKSSDIYENLSEYILLHQKVPDALSMEKLKKAIQESKKLK